MKGCHNLGVLYEQGSGVVQDVVKAAALYQEACDGGELQGCSDLGDFYAQGAGVDQDAARAAALYRKACAGGLKQACSRAK
jgi:TPR repeat protein